MGAVFFNDKSVLRISFGFCHHKLHYTEKHIFILSLSLSLSRDSLAYLSSMAATWRKLKKSLSAKYSFNFAAIDNAHSSSPPPPPSPPTPSSSFSSTFTLHSSSSNNICAICLSKLKRGEGNEIFVAECSHQFHFRCIVDNVKYGNFACPVCRARWNNLPFQAPSECVIDPPPNIHATRLNQSSFVDIHPIREGPERFSDDELLSITPTGPISPSQKLTVRSFLEYPAVSASKSSSALGVLLRICAPPLDKVHPHRAPIDLVTVLDVSRSMASKLGLLKSALGFIIRNLGPSDRLSIVAFSNTARRVLPLRKMYNNGRQAALRVVNSLTSGGGTNIVAGLKIGVRVLEERRECNPVVSMILLSDGKDTYSDNHNSYAHNEREYLNHLPASANPSNISSGEPCRFVTPVHTFGLGEDHDSITMHAISDASGGTFSFIESVDLLKEAFARRIDGLLSVLIQDVTMHIQSVTPGVQVKSIASGKYKSETTGSGHVCRIDVGDLYAEEKKDFLIYISVPVFSGVNDGSKLKTTSLVDIASFYKDSRSVSMIKVRGKRVEICRPTVALFNDETVSLEVDRHKNRILVTKAITDAQILAETGNLVGAESLLANEETRLLHSASAKAGDSLCIRLQSELRGINNRMKRRNEITAMEELMFCQE